MLLSLLETCLGEYIEKESKLTAMLHEINNKLMYIDAVKPDVFTTTDTSFKNKYLLIYEMHNFIQAFNMWLNKKNDVKMCTNDLYNMLNAHYNLDTDKKYWNDGNKETINSLESSVFSTDPKYVKMINIVSYDLTKKTDKSLGIMIINNKYELEATYDKPKSMSEGNYTYFLNLHAENMKRFLKYLNTHINPGDLQKWDGEQQKLDRIYIHLENLKAHFIDLRILGDATGNAEVGKLKKKVGKLKTEVGELKKEVTDKHSSTVNQINQILESLDSLDSLDSDIAELKKERINSVEVQCKNDIAAIQDVINKLKQSQS